MPAFGEIRPSAMAEGQRNRMNPRKSGERPAAGEWGKPGRPVLSASLFTAAIALLLRAAYLLGARDNPFWSHLGLDMAGYDRWARSILSGNGLGEAPFTQAPLFPLLLSAAYVLTGSQPADALWIHLLPATFTVFLVALAAGRWKGAGAAWVAGLAAAFYKPAIFYTGVLLPSTWVAFVAALWLYMVMRPIPMPGDAGSATSGAGRRPARLGAERGSILFAGLALGILLVGNRHSGSWPCPAGGTWRRRAARAGGSFWPARPRPSS
jgi:hypothetical protein